MNGSKLVLLSCVLIHCFIVTSNNWIKLAMNENDVIDWNMLQGISFLLYPLLGWIADVYVSRYKMIKLSFILLLIGSLLMVASGIERIFEKTDLNTMKTVLSIIILLISIVAIGVYEANAIQFGMQQLLEASSEQLSSFIYWYFWSFQLGPVITYYIAVLIFFYFKKCKISIDDSHGNNNQNTHIFGWIVLMPSLLQALFAFIGIIVMYKAKNCFDIHQVHINPLRKLSRVLWYAWKHKKPERRSAFTYWENTIPSRIDNGKQKYGGPFTYEEVENVKTFFRLLVLILSLYGCFLNSSIHWSNSLLIRNLGCPKLSLFLILVMNPDHIQQLISIIGIPLYQLKLRKHLSHLLPNLMTKIGIGLFLCLLQELTNPIIAFITIPTNQLAISCGLKQLDTFMKGNTSMVSLCLLANSNIHYNNTSSCSTFCPGLINNSHLFYISLLQQIIKGLSSLFVNLTVLEFICAQSPLSVKGLLIGIWYSLQSIQYSGINIIDSYIDNTNIDQWTTYSGIKGFGIFSSLVLYAIVSKFVYRYRKRNEVINEQGIIEEQYERELLYQNTST